VLALGHALAHLVQAWQQVARCQLVGFLAGHPSDQKQDVGQVVRQLTGLGYVHQPQLFSQLD
jgi:hypothetical protein